MLGKDINSQVLKWVCSRQLKTALHTASPIFRSAPDLLTACVQDFDSTARMVLGRVHVDGAAASGVMASHQRRGREGRESGKASGTCAVLRCGQGEIPLP